MNFPDDRDSRLEELLRSTLQAEADDVSSTGDGLARIRERTAARRSRRVWVRPLAVAAGIAVVAAAGATAYTLSRPKPTNTSLSTNPTPPAPTTSPSPSESPTPSTPVSPVTAFPQAGFYPFSTAEQEQAWAAQGGTATEPWLGDASATAMHFVSDFVGQPGVDTVVSVVTHADTATVTLGRNLSDAAAKHTVKVTTVHLVHVDKAWVVTGATDPGGYLTVASPLSGASISSPVTVSGPAFGVEESVQVDVRSATGRLTTGAAKTVSFGNGSPPWSTTVSFTPTSDAHAAVVLTEASPADGGPARIVATGVGLDTATLVDYPRYFYGIKDGRVTKLSSRDGAAISYLTAAGSSAAGDPQLVGTDVYYLARPTGCGATLRSVATAGGTTSPVATPQAGYSIASYGVSPGDGKVALFETACANDGSQPQGLLVVATRDGATTTSIRFNAFPPTIVGDPSWEPDGRHVDAVVRSGTKSSVLRIDTTTATQWSDATAACPSYDRRTDAGLPSAVVVDGSSIWFAVQTGSDMSVFRCTSGVAKQMFSVPGTDTPADVDVTGNGSAALLTDGAGKVWRWSAGGSVTQLSPRTPQPDVTW